MTEARRVLRGRRRADEEQTSADPSEAVAQPPRRPLSVEDISKQRVACVGSASINKRVQCSGSVGLPVMTYRPARREPSKI